MDEIKKIIEGLFLTTQDANGREVLGIKVMTGNPKVLCFLSNIVFSKFPPNSLTTEIEEERLIRAAILLDWYCEDYDSWRKNLLKPGVQFEFSVTFESAAEKQDYFLKFCDRLVASINKRFDYSWALQDETDLSACLAS